MSKYSNEEIIRKLKRQIARNEKKLSKLEDVNLTVHGHWSVGYHEGVISGLDLALNLLEDYND